MQTANRDEARRCDEEMFRDRARLACHAHGKHRGRELSEPPHHDRRADHSGQEKAKYAETERQSSGDIQVQASHLKS